MGYQGSQYISTTLPGKWVLFDWKLSLDLSFEIMAQVVPVPGAIEDGVSGDKLFLSKKYESDSKRVEDSKKFNRVSSLKYPTTQRSPWRASLWQSNHRQALKQSQKVKVRKKELLGTRM